MNVPKIRAALERMDTEHNGGRGPYATDVWCRWADSIQTVGLRACDQYAKCDCLSCYSELVTIAGILRESGVEITD